MLEYESAATPPRALVDFGPLAPESEVLSGIGRSRTTMQCSRVAATLILALAVVTVPTSAMAQTSDSGADGQGQDRALRR